MDKNIIEFGAAADGVTCNTAAMQSAIDACAASGGGRVTVPAGVYKTGTIWLRSNVELHLSAGAELLASDNMDDYNDVDAFAQNWSCEPEQWVGKHLIIAHELDNCALTGLGKINGNCHAFVRKVDTPAEKQFGWCYGKSEVRDPEKMRPGQLVCFIECTNVRVQDITIVDSPCWSCYFLGCEYVQVRGIKIFNPIWMLCADGIDIDASRYVTVSDCIVHTADDAITFRACEEMVRKKDIHCEYITVTNCSLSTTVCAFRVGVGVGDIRHIRVSDIVVSRCMNLVQFCTAYKDIGRANIEDVNFSGISAQHTDRGLDLFARNGAVIRNVTFENIRATSAMENTIKCYKGVIDNVTVRNLQLLFADKAPELSEESLERMGSCLLTVSGASNVTLDSVRVDGDLTGVTERFVVTDCGGLVKKDCNF